jgi:hypothetical protein
MPRPAFIPTKDQRMAVRVMVACGIPQESICQAIINHQTDAPLDRKTLRKAFRAELTDAKATANGLVAQSLFKKATGSGPQSVTAAIFWLKTQAGWRETAPAADPNAAPLVNFDLSGASVEQLRTLAGMRLTAGEHADG